MRALSVHAPWWWFIFHLGKDIENRPIRTNFRGTVLIHASKWWEGDEVIDDWYSMKGRVPDPWPSIDLTDLRQAGGNIVGQVDIVDCVETSSSPWFVGRYGYVLRNPILFAQPIPFRGLQGFFPVPDDLVRNAVPAEPS